MSSQSSAKASPITQAGAGQRGDQRAEFAISAVEQSD